MKGFTAFGSRKTHAFPWPLKAGGNSSEFCKGNGERRAAPAESEIRGFEAGIGAGKFT